MRIWILHSSCHDRQWKKIKMKIAFSSSMTLSEKIIQNNGDLLRTLRKSTGARTANLNYQWKSQHLACVLRKQCYEYAIIFSCGTSSIHFQDFVCIGTHDFIWKDYDQLSSCNPMITVFVWRRDVWTDREEIGRELIKGKDMKGWNLPGADWSSKAACSGMDGEWPNNVPRTWRP